MAVSSGDIVFVLSGGATNSDSDSSLGGAPSSTPIASNRLFDNVSEEETSDGHTDYRCFYVANNNIADTLHNAKLQVNSEVVGGANITFGVPQADEVQNITISSSTSSSPSGGTIVLSHEGSDATAAWDSNIGTWAQNIENALNSLSHLSEITVSGSHTFSTIYTASFTVTFTGADGNRNQELLELSSNNLTGSATFSINFATIAEGAPINAEAQVIPFESTTPFGITFGTTDIDIGDLRPDDLFPVWLKRVTSAGTEALQNDGITLRVAGNPF